MQYANKLHRVPKTFFLKFCLLVTPCIKYPKPPLFPPVCKQTASSTQKIFPYIYIFNCLLHAVYTKCSKQTNCIENQEPPLLPQILLSACSAHHSVSKQTPQILLTACTTDPTKKTFFLKFCLLHAVYTMQYTNKLHRVPQILLIAYSTYYA